MEKSLLHEAVNALAGQQSHAKNSGIAYKQAVRQFNSLLDATQIEYPYRVDITSMHFYDPPYPIPVDEYENAVLRLKSALDIGSLRPSVQSAREASLNVGRFGIPDLAAFSTEVAKFSGQDLISCLFMDLDNFKAVNDQHNHSVGDQVIQEAIRITELAVREKGSVFHRSGDEILVLLPNCDSAEACAVAERIRRVIEKFDFPTISQGFVTVTIGVSTSPDFCTFDQLEATADSVAMKAKKLGKNQVAHCSGNAATQRINASTPREAYDAQEGTRSELEASAERIEFLSLLLGRCDALYFLLDNRRWNDNDNAGVAIAKSEIQYHEADIYNTFRDRLGSNEVEDYFQKLGSIPDNLLMQAERINAHRNKLHALLQSERAQPLEVGLIAARQKQETLKRIEGN